MDHSILQLDYEICIVAVISDIVCSFEFSGLIVNKDVCTDRYMAQIRVNQFIVIYCKLMFQLSAFVLIHSFPFALSNNLPIGNEQAWEEMEMKQTAEWKAVGQE